MFRRASEIIVRGMIKAGTAAPESFEAYAYGTELFMIRAVFYAVLIILAVLTDSVIIGVVFTLSYLLLRQYSGGFHCSSPYACLAVSAVMYIAMAAGYRFISGYELICPVAAMLSAIPILIFSPCESDSNPLTDEEKQLYRRRAVSWVLIIAPAVLAAYLTELTMLYYPLSWSLTADAVLMIIYKFKKRKCSL